MWVSLVTALVITMVAALLSAFSGARFFRSGCWCSGPSSSRWVFAGGTHRPDLPGGGRPGHAQQLRRFDDSADRVDRPPFYSVSFSTAVPDELLEAARMVVE
jgi:hypothetical protein